VLVDPAGRIDGISDTFDSPTRLAAQFQVGVDPVDRPGLSARRRLLLDIEQCCRQQHALQRRVPEAIPNVLQLAFKMVAGTGDSGLSMAPEGIGQFRRSSDPSCLGQVTMLAKLPSRNRLTLPNEAIQAVGPTEYFEVEVRDGQIVLTPVQIRRADAVRAKLAD